MKLSREARRTARELFRLCLHDRGVDQARIRAVSDRVAEEKPREHLGILKEFSRLVRLELTRRHALVETAAAIDPAREQTIAADLKSKFGPDITVGFQINPSLLCGARVQLGSDVWDGSVRARLDAISRQL